MLTGRLTGFTLAPCLAVVLAGPLLPAARAAVTLPGNITVEEVDFERHLMGLFGRMGCNAGTCHGSFQGKGGFRLSLFGYDPAKDYTALTRENLGRRLNAVDPDRSLFLLKATGQIEHGGGRRFARDSWQYQLFREWIVKGAAWEKGRGDVALLTVSAGAYVSIAPGKTGQVRVRARFADGSEEDVTALCDFRVQEDTVAEVKAPGEVKALRPGDTALVVSYRGYVKALRVLVPMPARSGFRYPEAPEANYIDREVFAKLRRLNMVPSDLAGDAEFLRRVTIDTIGCLPAPEEVRAFLADRSPLKRAKKIEELLAHPLHAALWATKFSDITGNNTLALFGKNPQKQIKASQMWQDWFRKRVAENMPYDEIVRGVLCATSREGRTPEEWIAEVRSIDEAAQKGFETPYATRQSLDLFWRLGRYPTLEQLGERTAAAFMGIRLECAQCHKHPFDRWSQADYRAHANIFGPVAIGVPPESQEVIQAENQRQGLMGKAAAKVGLTEVFIGGKRRSLPHPDFIPEFVLNKKKKKVVVNRPIPLPAKALGGPVIEVETGEDPRVALFEWLRAPDNPYFARSFVNRVWGHYFGVGLVDPVDNFSLANPPSNPKLLDALAGDFVKHQFDIRALERTVLNSRVYQLSSQVNETNKLDRNNYSHSYLRPMMAEVVVDVLNSALGVTEYFGKEMALPPGKRAIEVASTRITDANLAFVFRTFGRPTRTLVCDCERPTEPALPQTLYLMTDPVVLAKIRSSAKPIVIGKGKPEVPKGKGKGKPEPLKGKGKPQQVPSKGKGKPQPPPNKVKGKPQQVPLKGKGKPQPPLSKGKGKPQPEPNKGKKQPQPAPAKGKPDPVPPKNKIKPQPTKDQPQPAPAKGKGKLQPVPAKGKPKAPPPKVKVKPKAKPGKVKIKLPPVQAQEGRLAKLLKSNKTDDEVLDELFLATLTRYPTPAEKKHFAEYRVAKKSPETVLKDHPNIPKDHPKFQKLQKMRAQQLVQEREEAFVAALWALINTREFILNH